MAKYNLDKYTSADGLGFPLNFRRGNPNPLDNSSVWSTLEAAQNYATNDPVAYVGQVLTVVDNINSTATVYSIQDEAGTLKKVGTSPVGDESTITVAEDGTISLFGVAGLELTRTEEDGSTTKINYQPLLVDGKLTWVEPSATTVEGLATEIEGIKTRLSTIETTIGNAESGLVKDIADINNKIGTVAEGKTIVEMISDAQDAATYDDTELANKVNTLIGDDISKSARTIASEEVAKIVAGADASYDTLKEIADWISSHKTDATAMNSAITALEGIVDGIGGEGEKATVVAYVTDAIEALKIGDYAKAADLTTLAGRVSTLESIGAEKNVIASVDETQFAIDEDRKLTLLDIAISKVTGLFDALNNKVDKVEGSRLITASEISKLESLVIGDDGQIEISGKINASNIQELDTWITNNRDSVAGLFDTTSATKLNGIETGAQVNDLEVIKIAGNALAITDKAVDIPIATTEALGVVLSSTAENKISIGTDGTMEVNNVNVNKLTQTDGDFLILNGGSSAN